MLELMGYLHIAPRFEGILLLPAGRLRSRSYVCTVITHVPNEAYQTLNHQSHLRLSAYRSPKRRLRGYTCQSHRIRPRGVRIELSSETDHVTEHAFINGRNDASSSYIDNDLCHNTGRNMYVTIQLVALIGFSANIIKAAPPRDFLLRPTKNSSLSDDYPVSLGVSAIPQCDPAAYGTNLNPSSCLQAWTRIGWGEDQISWGNRGTIELFNVYLPTRWSSGMSSTTSDRFDPIDFGNRTC